MSGFYSHGGAIRLAAAMSAIPAAHATAMQARRRAGLSPVSARLALLLALSSEGVFGSVPAHEGNKASDAAQRADKPAAAVFLIIDSMK